MANPIIPIPSDPQLTDIILFELQTELVNSLYWMDQAYGMAQRMKGVNDQNKQIIFPAVYAGGKDYLKVFPDSHLGNFSFFDIKDGADLKHNGRRSIYVKMNFGIVFWFDLRSIYPDEWHQKTNENVKYEVLEALKQARLYRSSIKVTKIYNEARNIYPGYTDNEIEDQFLMRPFGGFRIEGEISFQSKQDPCVFIPPPTGIGWMIVEDTNIVA